MRAYNRCHRASVIPTLIALCVICLSCGAASAPQDRPANSGDFLVKISEAQTDLSPDGVNASDCILVRPDGRFHFERRKQKLPNPTAALKILESTLDAAQLRQLKDILNDERVKRLLPYRRPTLPMDVAWLGGLNAKIARGSKVQEVGYLIWRGGKPGRSPASTPENVKKAWQESETALRPLVEWFHAVKALKLEPSDAKSTLCGSDLEIAD